MIKSFADRWTEELFVIGTTKRFPPDVISRTVRKLEYVHCRFIDGDAHDVEGCDYH